MTLLDAFETSKMTMLKFDTLPGTDVLTYLAERATYSEQMVAEITAQVLDALSYIHWRGKVSEKAEDERLRCVSCDSQLQGTELCISPCTWLGEISYCPLLTKLFSMALVWSCLGRIW